METPDGLLKIPAPPVPLRVETIKELADAGWIGVTTVASVKRSTKL
jgi:hypothetical protein